MVAASLQIRPRNCREAGQVDVDIIKEWKVARVDGECGGHGDAKRKEKGGRMHFGVRSKQRAACVSFGVSSCLGTCPGLSNVVVPKSCATVGMKNGLLAKQKSEQIKL